MKINTFLLLLLLGGSPVAANAQSLYDNNRQCVTAVAPDVPESMYFAGTEISFDRIDMFERLDREIISFMYGHTNTLLSIKRANRYFPAIVPILEKNGIPKDFAYLAVVESFLENRAISSAKAGGIWQLMPATARQYGLEVNDEIDERFHLEKATEAACKYFKAAYNKYKCWTTVAASYNAGMGRISSELSKQNADNGFDLFLNNETSRYMFRLLAIKLIMEHPKDYGFYIAEEQLYFPVDYTVERVSSAVPSWAEWAESKGITYAQLREMNPWIRSRDLTNKNKKTYNVKIPNKKHLFRSTQPHKIYNRNWIQIKK